ncbi:hypothetical protein ABK040_007824 [Willaertia magna]
MHSNVQAQHFGANTNIVVDVSHQRFINDLIRQADFSLDQVSSNLSNLLECFFIENPKKRKSLEEDHEDLYFYTNSKEKCEDDETDLEELRTFLTNNKSRCCTLQGKKELLKEWLMNHRHNPYPSEKQKDLFMNELGFDKKQINNWFINARKRYLRKKIVYSPPDIQSKNQFDTILESKVRESLNNSNNNNGTSTTSATTSKKIKREPKE